MSVSGELIVKPPKGFNAPSWVRSSLQNPSSGFDDPVELLLLAKAGYKTPMMQGFGMHPSFMIPAASASASSAMFNGIKLDELRRINMGHLNPRLHRETLHLQSCKTTTTTAGRPELYSSGSRSCEVLKRSSLDMMMMVDPIIFTVPETWRKRSISPIKVRNDRTPSIHHANTRVPASHQPAGMTPKK
jgi:hypothetical protein